MKNLTKPSNERRHFVFDSGDADTFSLLPCHQTYRLIAYYDEEIGVVVEHWLACEWIDPFNGRLLAQI
jgi:hypothetical protein